jgi:YbbR domain-containing protein
MKRYAWLARDLFLKIFSLAVSIGLFFFVSLEKATPIDVEFTLEYRLNDDSVFINEPPKLLRATLQGPWAAFRSYDNSTLESVAIDLTHAPLGPQRIMLEPSIVHPPPGMRVLSVHPSSIEFILDRLVERRLNIRADLTGKTALGFSVGTVRFIPEKVRIQGPTSRMSNVEFISTQSISIHNLSSDFSTDIDLRPLPPPLRLLEKRVTVYVDIIEELIERTFQNIPVMLEGAPPQSRFSPSTIDISLKGPRRLIDRIQKTDLEAYVDVIIESQQTPQTLEKGVRLRHELPERVQWIGSAPKIRIFLPATNKKSRRISPIKSSLFLFPSLQVTS